MSLLNERVSRNVTLGAKVSVFFEGLEKFESTLASEMLMATFYFVHGILFSL